MSVNIFEEDSDPSSLPYKMALSEFVNQSLLVKEVFIFSGIVKQLRRLDLTKKNVKFPESWMVYWWILFYTEKIRDETLVQLCQKLQVEEWLVRAYLRLDFFTKYDQAKIKYSGSLQENKSP